MSHLTLTDIFGNNAIYKSSNQTVTFSLTDLSLDRSKVTEKNIDSYAAKIFWAILQKIHSNMPENVNAKDLSITVQPQGKRSLIREGTSQLGFQTLVTGYVNDPMGTTVNADELI